MTMAVSNQDEDQLKQGQSGASGSAYLGGAGTQNANTQVAQQTPGNNFTNLTSYLDANQAGSQKMGTDVANSVAQSGQTAANDITTQGNNLISQGTQNVSQDTLKSIGAGAPTVSADVEKQIAGGTHATPVSYAGPSAVDASYKGPSDYAGILNSLDATGQNDITHLSNQVARVQSGEITPELQQIYGQGTQYTPGEMELDKFVTNAGQGNAAVQNEAGKWKGDNATGTGFSGIQSALEGNIKSAKDTSQQTQDTYDKAITSGQQAAKDVNNQYATDWQNYQTAQAAKDQPAPRELEAPRASTQATNMPLREVKTQTMAPIEVGSAPAQTDQAQVAPSEFHPVHTPISIPGTNEPINMNAPVSIPNIDQSIMGNLQSVPTKPKAQGHTPHPIYR